MRDGYDDFFGIQPDDRDKDFEEFEMVDYGGTRSLTKKSKSSKTFVPYKREKNYKKTVPTPFWLKPFEQGFDVVSTLSAQGGFICLEDFKNSSQGENNISKHS
jgi:hypothetical protein